MAYVIFGIRIVRPTHRVLVEILGKFQKFGGPGFYWILPGIQKLYAVNITEKMVDATPHRGPRGDTARLAEVRDPGDQGSPPFFASSESSGTEFHPV